MLNRSGKVLAAYYGLIDVVNVFNYAPTIKEMWLMLATAGTLPDVVANLDHELTHNEQYAVARYAIGSGSRVFPPDPGMHTLGAGVHRKKLHPLKFKC